MLKMYSYRVSLKEDGRRLDNSVTVHLNESRPELEISRSLIQRLIKSGTILLNQKRVKAHTKVKRGDEVIINLEILLKEEKKETESKTPKPEPISLDIIYEDEDLLAVNKPAGMVVHPAAGNYSGTLVNALLNRPEFRGQGSALSGAIRGQRSTLSGAVRGQRRTLSGAVQRDWTAGESLLKTRRALSGAIQGGRIVCESKLKGQIFRPGIIHRLDKDTSGIILVAKNEIAHRKLSKQMKSRSVTKTYIAVVKGIVEQDEGLIDAPIAHDEKNRKKMAIRKDIGKDAVTYYRVISRNKDKNWTVLEIRPKTGRTHQIRIHLAHIGHPILGDILYGGPLIEGLSRQALHAKSTGFVHPTKKEFLELSAEIPDDLKQFLE